MMNCITGNGENPRFLGVVTCLTLCQICRSGPIGTGRLTRRASVHYKGSSGVHLRFAMASFWVVDLTGTGEVRLKQEYEYRLLEPLPGAIDLIGLFSMHLWRSPEEFLVSLPGGGKLNMRWR